MTTTFGSKLKHAWNAFLDQDPKDRQRGGSHGRLYCI
jgi:hypothetical protein